MSNTVRSIFFTYGPPLFPFPGELFLVPEPENCVCEQRVLCRVGVNLFPMAHIHVDHSVFRVRPYHGKVAAGNDVLDADGVVRWIERDKDTDILVGSRAGLPEIPFVRRCRVTRGKRLGYGMRAVATGELSRQRRP